MDEQHNQGPQNSGQQSPMDQMQQTFSGQGGVDANPKEVEEYKVIGIISYIFTILFFLPLVMDNLKTNSFAKYHANQQLVLLIAAVAGSIIVGILISVIAAVAGNLAGILSLLSLAYNVLILILVILGIMNVVNGKKRPLPVIGGITLLK
jgi:uncharacterized membrane protein